MSLSEEDENITCFLDKYFGTILVGSKIGNGSFGVIHEGRHKQSGEKIAIKFENINATSPLLPLESEFYKMLNGLSRVPKCYFSGREDKIYFLGLELLGESLRSLFTKCNKMFTLKTVFMLAIQMIKCLEDVHSRGLIHCDIKPDNFVIGLNDKSSYVFIIDFGLARRYIDNSNKHIHFKTEVKTIGNLKYATRNMHAGAELSRRDDMESLGYVLINFIRGQLPWQGLHASDEVIKRQLVYDMKILIPITLLCEGLPQEFLQYFQHCRQLAFIQKPDYDYLCNLFEMALDTYYGSHQRIFDWLIEETLPPLSSLSSIIVPYKTSDLTITTATITTAATASPISDVSSAVNRCPYCAQRNANQHTTTISSQPTSLSEERNGNPMETDIMQLYER